MDHILQLHVEHHHHYCSLKRSDSGVERFRKTVDDASQQVVVLAFAAMAFVALLFLPSFTMGRPLSPWLLAAGSCLLSTKTVLFVLSNAIFALLAADCRWFFATGTASASGGGGGGGVSAFEPGDVLEKRGRHGHEDLHRHAVLSCVPASNQGRCLQNKNSITASEAFTELVMVPDTDNTTMSEALEEQEGDVPAMSRTEILELDEGDDSVALELGTDAVEQPTCEIAGGLNELDIEELNKKFDEFIQSRRSKWIKEETLLAVAVAPCLTC